MQMGEFPLKFHWSLFLMVKLTIFEHGFGQRIFRLVGAKPLSEPIMVRFSMQIYVTWPQWIIFHPPAQMSVQGQYLSFRELDIDE